MPDMPQSPRTPRQQAVVRELDRQLRDQYGARSSGWQGRFDPRARPFEMGLSREDGMCAERYTELSQAPWSTPMPPYHPTSLAYQTISVYTSSDNPQALRIAETSRQEGGAHRVWPAEREYGQVDNGTAWPVQYAIERQQPPPLGPWGRNEFEATHRSNSRTPSTYEYNRFGHDDGILTRTTRGDSSPAHVPAAAYYHEPRMTLPWDDQLAADAVAQRALAPRVSGSKGKISGDSRPLKWSSSCSQQVKAYESSKTVARALDNSPATKLVASLASKAQLDKPSKNRRKYRTRAKTVLNPDRSTFQDLPTVSTTKHIMAKSNTPPSAASEIVKPTSKCKPLPLPPNNGWGNFFAQISLDDKRMAVENQKENGRLGGERFRPEIRETYKDQSGRKQVELHQKVAGNVMMKHIQDDSDERDEAGRGGIKIEPEQSHELRSATV